MAHADNLRHGGRNFQKTWDGWRASGAEGGDSWDRAKGGIGVQLVTSRLRFSNQLIEEMRVILIRRAKIP